MTIGAGQSDGFYEERLHAPVISSVFTLLAMLTACMIGLVIGPTIPMPHPGVPILAVTIVWLRLSSPAPVLLQHVIGFYLFCLPINQIAASGFTFILREVHVSISYSVIIVLIGMVGYGLDRQNRMVRPASGGLLSAWRMAIGVVTIHLIVLFCLLRIYYGFGYESSLTVLGQVFLYFLLFLASWKSFLSVIFRRIIGSVFTFYCILVWIIGS